MLSFLMAKRPIMNGGLTGLRCQSIVSEIRKSGPVVFSRFQEMWGSAVFTSDPENLDQLYFQVPRKFGELYLYVVQKIWTNCIFTYPRYLDLGEWCLHVVQKIWTNCIFSFPGNLGGWCLHVVQKIWISCIITYPGNLGGWCLHVVQKFWTSCILKFPGTKLTMSPIVLKIHSHIITSDKGQRNGNQR